MASTDAKFDDLLDAYIDSHIDNVIPKNTKKATGWGISVLNGKLTNFKFFIQAISGVFTCSQQFCQHWTICKVIIIFFSFVCLLDWLSQKYPNEVLESLSPEVLSERVGKLYKALRNTENYSASAHLSIRAAIDRYLNTLLRFSSISIIGDQQFKIANKSLSAKLKQLKAHGFAKVQNRPSISSEDIQKCYETKVFSDETLISLVRANWFNISLHFGAVEGRIFEP